MYDRGSSRRGNNSIQCAIPTGARYNIQFCADLRARERPLDAIRRNSTPRESKNDKRTRDVVSLLPKISCERRRVESPKHFSVMTRSLTSHPQFQPSKKKVATSNDSSFRSPPLPSCRRRVLGVATSNHRAASRSKDAVPTRIELVGAVSIYTEIIPRCHSYILNSIAFNSRCIFFVENLARLLDRKSTLLSLARRRPRLPTRLRPRLTIRRSLSMHQRYRQRADCYRVPRPRRRRKPLLVAATSAAAAAAATARPYFLFLPSRGEAR